ncbi:MAG: stage IV sporulation protein A [Bacilli bacterium]|nr:stage IV sporulation protein A [Bacilli bacterium]
MIHCLIAIFKNIKGYHENRSYWYDEEIPFVEAAEIGTEKVIKDHSSIGIVVTTDGSFGEISRNNYIEAETRIVEELKEIGKPFIVILNSAHPTLPETERMAEKLKEEYKVPVLPMSIEGMGEKDVYSVLRESLYEFPVTEVKVNMPDWIACLNPTHSLKLEYIEKIRESVIDVDKLRDIEHITTHFENCDKIKKSYISDVDTSTGIVTINLEAPDYLYDEVLKETMGISVRSKADLLMLFQDYNEAKTEYDQIKSALQMVRTTGYGVASPTLKDMKLETPEVVKQGSRYGIKLKAVAPSIHMIRVDVESTFEPIIGTELQSKQLIDYLMKDKDTDPQGIWKSEIFGRSIDNIVKEGIQAKLSLTPENARYKLQQTLTKLVNKGSGNLFAIVI